MPLSASARALRETPLDDSEFADLMARLGPFEPVPRLAAAVSGGADSLALAVLASAWARALGGSLTALVVDHRLRPGSTEEARHTAGLLRDQGIAAVILACAESTPRAGIEAAARRARYRLMGQWCAAHCILHLLVGHHCDDQAETVLMRLAAGSGLDGLAAMPAVQETRWGRLLRPLLPVSRERLRALLRARGLRWVEDPANSEEIFARARLRRSAAALAGEGLTAGRLSRTAARVGRGRAVLEGATSTLLAAAVWIHPAGFAHLDTGVIARAPADLAWRVLERVVRTIGAGDYAPRRERLQRLFEIVRGAGLSVPCTLGGCLIGPEPGGVVVVREPAAVGAAIPVAAGAEVLWDGRFRIGIAPCAGAADGLRVGALGRAGWRTLKAAGVTAGARCIPPAARPGLPALHDRWGLREVPHLGYARGGATAVERLAFTPPHPLAAAEFSVV